VVLLSPPFSFIGTPPPTFGVAPSVIGFQFSARPP
jgi:hypothetical protein